MSQNIAYAADGTPMAAFSNTPAWHHEGTVIDTDGKKAMTVAQAVKATGLDWEVAKFPAYGPKLEGGEVVDGEVVTIPDRFSVIRLSDGKPFGTVGKTWQPFQNMEGFALLDDLMNIASGGDYGQLWIESGGALDGGKKVWLLAHVENDYQIAGEDYNQYILFTNGHDGRASVTAAMTNVRVVCQNTLSLALSNTPRVVRVRHTNRAADRIKEAIQILGLRDQYAEQLAIQGEFLAEQSMNDAQFEDFLSALMSTEQEPGTPGHTMVDGRRQEMRVLYQTAPNLDAIRSTRWGALQAAIEYSDYAIKRDDTEASLKAAWGINPTPIKQAAFDILKQKKIKPLVKA